VNYELNGHAVAPPPELPPHNEDDERSVLGCMLRDNSVIPVVAHLLIQEHFYGDANGKVFRAIADLHGDGKPVDPSILASELKQRGQIDGVGAGYIGQLWLAQATGANAEYYAKIVKEYALRRDAINSSQRLIREARNPSGPFGETLERHEAETAALRSTGGAFGLPGRRFKFDVIDSPSFAATEYPRQWLIKKVLVKDQPAIAGGPRKALKTSMLLVDLAVSLGTATPFLGEFQVPRPVRAAVLSGESGEATLQDVARRVCIARGFGIEEANVLWKFDLPSLSSAADLTELRRGLEANRVEVTIIDPLYLGLLSGQTEQRLQAGNLFDMGPLLYNVAQACLSVGCTPILIHHSVKRLADPYEPMELEDLAFAGIQEFARQWLLVNRREPFDPDTGSNRLWLSVGGSAGHAGLWAVDVEEGVLGDDFQGRRWDVTVRTERTGREAKAEAVEAMKDQEKQRREKADDARALLAIDKLTAADGGKAAPTKTQIRACAGLSGDKATLALLRLVGEGIVEETKTETWGGKNNTTKKDAIGYRRTAFHSNGRTDRTDRIETPFDRQSVRLPD
jgi:DnaB-like helicase N terminal domain/AAA domain